MVLLRSVQVSGPFSSEPILDVKSSMVQIVQLGFQVLSQFYQVYLWETISQIRDIMRWKFLRWKVTTSSFRDDYDKNHC